MASHVSEDSSYTDRQAWKIPYRENGHPDDIIEHTAYSADFKGYLIIHSAELKKEIMAMTSGIRLQQAGQLKKLHTRQELSEEESLRLRKQVELIKSYIPDKEHHIENENLKRQTFNANFTEKETLEEILSVLQISARYKIEKRKGEIFLK